MAVPGSINELLIGAANAGAGGYEIERSLRINSADSAYLDRTPASAGNRRTWTWAGWVKLNKSNSNFFLGAGTTGTTNYTYARFGVYNDKIQFLTYDQFIFTSDAVFRDYSGWGHITLVCDTTESTAADRLKVYWNGVQLTNSAATTLDSNGEYAFNNTLPHTIGSGPTFGTWDGYLADLYFIDGQALDPTDFGEFDDNGVWQPIEVDASLISGSITEGTGALSLYNLGNTFASKASPATFRTDPYASNLQTAVAGDSSNEVSYLIRGSGSALTLTNTDVTFNQTGKYYSDAYLIQNAGSACEVAETSGNKPGTSDFCVEFWINPTATPSNAGLFSYGDYNTAGSFGIMTTGSNSIRVDMHDGVTSGSRLSVAGGLQANEWQHFALTRSGTICTLYRNGTSQGSWLIAAGADFTPASNPRYAIGNRLGLGFGSYNITSYFQDFRVYVGTEKYSGNFTLSTQTGANGFHLPFSDNSSVAALGTDTSGNENDWTVNNISVSPGADNDSLFDSPTNGTQEDTGAGGEVRGNYATWNQLIVTTNNTLSQGNLQASHASSTGWSGNSQQSNSSMFVGNMGMSSGKWYWEIAIDSATDSSIGIVNRPGGHNNYVGYPVNGIAEAWGWAAGGTIYHTSGITNDGGTLNTYAVNGTSILGFALDMDNGRLYVSNNGTYENSGDPAAGTGYCASGMSGTYYFAASQLGSNSTWTGTVNTGQRLFAYSAPTGFKALCTANLPDPTIADGTDYFEPLPWTGDGTGSRAFTGLSFEPSLTWVKIRTQSYTHILFDAVRTAGSGKELQPNSTNIEGQADTNLYGYLSSFDSNGFSSTAGTSDNDYFNRSGDTYVAWNWNAGTSTDPANTDGTITSSVRANPSAGFSIVSYTGTGSAGTIGHGLNVEPSFLIVKTTETAASTNWTIYHKSVGNTEAAYFDNSPFSPSSGYWNNTSPTSSVVTVGNFDVVNAPSKELIMYAFAPVAGYSAFGTYVGNGVAGDGTFVALDFAPAFVIIKAVDYASANWILFDNKRPGYNLNNEPFYVNLSDPDGSSYRVVDLLSNGFKLRDPGGNSAALADTNLASEIYMYAAFAENPFKLARAR